MEFFLITDNANNQTRAIKKKIFVLIAVSSHGPANPPSCPIIHYLLLNLPPVFFTLLIVKLDFIYSRPPPLIENILISIPTHHLKRNKIRHLFPSTGLNLIYSCNLFPPTTLS